MFITLSKPLDAASLPQGPRDAVEARSPPLFSDRPFSNADLDSLLAASRWIVSSFHEQSWTYFAATRESPREFTRILSCLASATRAWAESAQVLILGIVGSVLSKAEKDNATAIQDLATASAALVTEAASRALSVHQTNGILPDRARLVFGIPEHAEAWTALAIGYTAEAHACAAGSGCPDAAATPLAAESARSPEPRAPSPLLFALRLSGAAGRLTIAQRAGMDANRSRPAGPPRHPRVRSGVAQTADTRPLAQAGPIRMLPIGRGSLHP